MNGVEATTLTFGIVARPRRASSSNEEDGVEVEKEEDWVALGLSDESQGMKGMDVAILMMTKVSS